MFKKFLIWYHKRKAHKYNINMFFYPKERDKEFRTNQECRREYKALRDYHTNEIIRLQNIEKK